MNTRPDRRPWAGRFEPAKICRQMNWVNWQCGRFRLDETTLLLLVAASIPLAL
jgi:hypothetical protein